MRRVSQDGKSFSNSLYSQSDEIWCCQSYIQGVLSVRPDLFVLVHGCFSNLSKIDNLNSEFMNYHKKPRSFHFKFRSHEL